MDDASSLKIPKSELSRYVDSSTTTQMALIMVQSVRSSFGRTVNGKGNLRKSY